MRKTIKQRRHALLGTACLLGLVLAPVTGSAVVVGVTAAGRPPAQSPAQFNAQPAAVPEARPLDGRRAR